MIRQFAARIGASYGWGLANFTAGVASTAFCIGLATSLGLIEVHHVKGELKCLSGLESFVPAMGSQLSPIPDPTPSGEFPLSRK